MPSIFHRPRRPDRSTIWRSLAFAVLLSGVQGAALAQQQLATTGASTIGGETLLRGDFAKAYESLSKELDSGDITNEKRAALLNDRGVAQWRSGALKPALDDLNKAATLYPGIGAIEYSNISVGRGTDQPFEQLGAPWIDGMKLAATLNARGLPGIRFYPVTFTPSAGAKLGGQACHGVFLIVTDRDRIKPVRAGLEIAAALSSLYGPEFRLEDAASLFGSKATLAKIRAGDDPASIAAAWGADEAAWRLMRATYLLY